MGRTWKEKRIRTTNRRSKRVRKLSETIKYQHLISHLLHCTFNYTIHNYVEHTRNVSEIFFFLSGKVFPKKKFIETIKGKEQERNRVGERKINKSQLRC